METSIMTTTSRVNRSAARPWLLPLWSKVLGWLVAQSITEANRTELKYSAAVLKHMQWTHHTPWKTTLTLALVVALVWKSLVTKTNDEIAKAIISNPQCAQLLLNICAHGSSFSYHMHVLLQQPQLANWSAPRTVWVFKMLECMATPPATIAGPYSRE